MYIFTLIKCLAVKPVYIQMYIFTLINHHFFNTIPIILVLKLYI